MFKIKTKFINADEKRQYINECCDQFEVDFETDTCVGCPLCDDVNSWCRRGHVSNIDEYDLDSIIAQFNKLFYEERNTRKYTISGVYSSQGPYLYMDIIPTDRIGGTDHICLQGLFGKIIPQNSKVTMEITVVSPDIS